ncbi:amidohydrolase family protein [Mangrovicella endophytica]|uniref:amidohydrolase family protein n=1 Tax=Mangrovicella endophytica TaxID=2066697 RepID=UPI0018E48146|nr:amidohydrolase family protein [Mangrovicella endophytica]
MSLQAGTLSPHHPVRPAWLSQHSEVALDPGLEIVDSHHHLWDRPENPYGAADFLNDAAAGHRIVSSVFIECGTHYRSDGPVEFRPVGEVAFAAGVAGGIDAQVATSVSAAIVGHVDLTSPEAEAVIAAEQAAAQGRLRGVRQIAAWHADPAARASLASPPPDLLSDARFHKGLRVLAARGLSLDVFVYHTQLGQLLDLVQANPDLTFVVDHIGGPIGIGPYRSKRDTVFTDWHAGMRRLAGCPNVRVKLTGLGMRLFGFGFVDRPQPPSSRDLANAWAPYVETCIALFGAERCMFGSNFPVDKGTCSYAVLWNAFKRITAEMNAEERAALFAGTARRVYRLTH